MVEHYVRDVGAAGSNPVTSTKNPHSQEWGFTFSLFTILYAFIKRIFGSDNTTHYSYIYISVKLQNYKNNGII